MMEIALTFRRTTLCPACSMPVGVSGVFLPAFACPHCGATLKVALFYIRFLVVFAGLCGYALAWEVSRLCPPAYFFGIPTLFLLLWVPLGFIVLVVLVRVGPFLIKPRLVLEWPNYLTTLNITSKPFDDHQI
jgi:hypothetical protein